MLSQALFVVGFLTLVYAGENITRTSQIPVNCRHALLKGYKHGIVTILPGYANKPFPVLCDMKTLGGGWTHILRRYNGSIRFDRNWNDYVNGFGGIEGEHWLGLKYIHELTGYEINELLVQFIFSNKTTIRSLYKSFSIGDSDTDFTLNLVEEDPTWQYFVKECMIPAGGLKFSTKDRDNDLEEGHNIAEFRQGGWWFWNNNTCSSPTGLYPRSKKPSRWNPMFWADERGSLKTIKAVRMMVRPRNQSSPRVKNLESYYHYY